jgi:hypothetical protein
MASNQSEDESGLREPALSSRRHIGTYWLELVNGCRSCQRMTTCHEGYEAKALNKHP